MIELTILVFQPFGSALAEQRPCGSIGSMRMLCLMICVMLLPCSGMARSIMVLGDSLVSGYGIAKSQSFPAQLEQKLQREGYDLRVINEGVSGHTSTQGLARVDQAIAKHNPTYGIVVLGGNDILRRQSPNTMERNLQTIAKRFGAKHIPLLLAGLSLPGPMIQSKPYERAFKAVAKRQDLVFYPSFLSTVWNKPPYMLDQIHPNAKGIEVIVDDTYPYVRQLIR